MILRYADHPAGCTCNPCGETLFSTLAGFWERKAERSEGPEWSDYAEQAAITGKTAAAYRAAITRTERPREGA